MGKAQIKADLLNDLLNAVAQIAPTLKQHAAEAEQKRQLSQPVVDAMVEAGLFRLWAPKEYGGWELDPMSAFRIFEEVARLDRAAGWNLQLSTAVHPFLIHTVAGSSAIRSEHKFQQHFRDVHTITQHAHSSTSRYQAVGNLMFGLEMDWPFFAL